MRCSSLFASLLLVASDFRLCFANNAKTQASLSNSSYCLTQNLPKIVSSATRAATQKNFEHLRIEYKQRDVPCLKKIYTEKK
jgi:hypothetical protein